MPTYKFDSESESEDDLKGKAVPLRLVDDDDGEADPDDTFYFRQSFTNARRRPIALPIDDDMDEATFETEAAEDDAENSYEGMQVDHFSDIGSSVSRGEDDEEGEEDESEYDPLPAVVRIEKQATWLEQIEYTDPAATRLKAIETRESLQNAKVHWGGQIPKVKYSPEDLERDLFGESAKPKNRSGLDYLQADALKQGIFDQKSWDTKEAEQTKPNPTFRMRWGHGNVLIHRPSPRNHALDVGVVSLTRLHLTAVESDAAEKQAQRLIERQVEHTVFNTDPSGLPIAQPSSTLQFQLFSDNSSLYSGAFRPVDEHENYLWRLASILFDDLPPNTGEEEHRKRELSSFLKELVSRSVWNDINRSRDPAERIFLNLTGYRIVDACIEATKTKDYHLATLLAIAEGSTQEFRRDLHSQLESWRKDGSNAEIQLWYRAIYEVLAGEIDLRGTALAQLNVGKGLDWRRAFAMRLWFSVPNDGEIKDAVQEYWMACQQDANIPKPIPWYVTQQVPSGVYDGLFQLLRLYAGSGVNNILDDALNPYSFTSAVTDVRISWHLYIILSRLKGKATFADVYGAKGDNISEMEERLTLGYVTQLEHLNLWQWAIYIALHLKRQTTRKGIILDILARNIATVQCQVEEQGIISRLVDQWRIPMEWILEAKALHARSEGDHFGCAKNLALAKSFVEAQKTILTHIGPQAVISTRLSNLEELLLMFDSEPPGWDVGGQLYLDYILLAQEHGTVERRRRGAGSKRDCVLRLLRGLPRMEARTFEQGVARSEMSRLVATVILSSPEMSREVGSIMRLPLVEGDALRFTRKVAGGMLDVLTATQRKGQDLMA